MTNTELAVLHNNWIADSRLETVSMTSGPVISAMEPPSAAFMYPSLNTTLLENECHGDITVKHLPS